MHKTTRLFAWTRLLLPLLLLPLLFACPRNETPAAPKVATVSAFTVEPTSLTGPGKVTLRWETSDAEALELKTLEGVSIDTEGGAGSVTVDVSASTVFVLKALADGGSDTAIASVAVTAPLADPLFNAVPVELVAGASTTLVWNVPGSDPVTITADGAPLHTGEAYGSLEVRPAFNTSYQLTAGERIAERSVRVTPGIMELSAVETQVRAGATVTVQWKAGGAEKVTLSASDRGELFSTTDRAQITDGSHQEVLPAVMPSNGVVQYVLTAQAGALIARRTVTVYVDDQPHIVDFKAPEYAKLGAAFSISWITAQADGLEVAVDGVVVHRALSQSEVNAGTLALPTPLVDSEVELRVRNARGAVATEKKLVSPVGLPSVTSFTSNVAAVNTGGDPATLTWTAPNARHVELRENGRLIATFDGIAAEQGSIAAYPNKLSEYDLLADNTLGDKVTETTSVDATIPAKVLFNLSTAPKAAAVQITGTTVQNGGALSGFPLVNDAADAFVDISGSGTDIAYQGSDSALKLVHLPEVFTTSLFGTAVSEDWLSISPNGWMVFGTQQVDGQDDPLQAPLESYLPPLALAPLYADLFMSDGAIYYRIDTVGTDKRLIVQWDGVEHQWTNTGPATFQVQVYSSGKVVFAYDTLGNGFGSEVVLVGRVNAEGNGSDAFYRPVVAADTIAWGLELFPPIAFEAHDVPFSVIQKIGAGTIAIDVTYPLITAGQLAITEVNVTPATTVTSGQWFEVENRTTSPFDLAGWELDFGNGNTHAIAPNTVIPPSGRMVFAAVAGAGDGVTVGYVYPASLALAPGGSLALKIVGAKYDELSIPTNLAPGRSWQRGPIDPTATAAAGVTELACAAHLATAYGTHGQKGTPGAANTTCPGYTMNVTGTASFEPIALTGTQLVFADGDEDVLELQLTTPVLVHGRSYSTLYVGTNGFISLQPLSCDWTTDAMCFWDNKSDPSQATPKGLIAPHWDDLDTNTGGVYWERKTGYTIVSWENVAEYGNSMVVLNFQVKFFDTGAVEFHSGTFANESFASATTWLEDAGGYAAYVVGANSSIPGGAANRRFAFVPK